MKFCWVALVLAACAVHAVPEADPAVELMSLVQEEYQVHCSWSDRRTHLLLSETDRVHLGRVCENDEQDHHACLPDANGNEQAGYK